MATVTFQESAQQYSDKFPIPPAQMVTNLFSLLKSGGEEAILALIASASVEIRVDEYDNWNGGTYTWGLCIRIPMMDFGRITASEKESIQKVILEQVRRLFGEFENDGIGSVQLVPILLPADTAPGQDYDDERGFPTRESFQRARELEFIRPLGSGGYGELVLVQRRHLGTHLAVKFFAPHPFVTDTPERRQKARERLLREGSLLASIRHSNVLRLFDCTMIGGDPALVLEYIDGVTLDKMRRDTGPLTPPDALRYVTQVLDALVECHAKGVIHRDVSPKNIMVEQSGRAVLIDFGLGVSEELLGGSRLTSQALGTPGYRAPELDVDPLLAEPTVDVFSVGAVATFLLTGQQPQVGIPPVLPNVPVGVVAAITRALEPDPSRRLKSAREMRDLLRPAAPVSLGSASSPASGLLTAAEHYELLGIATGAPLDDLDRALIAQFDNAVGRLSAVKQDRDVGLALLLAGARAQLDEYWGVSGSNTRCFADEIRPSWGRLIATVAGALEAPNDGKTTAIFADAIKRGWLSEDSRDTWRPGMASGSGWRNFFTVTSLGHRWLKATAGFDPPMKPKKGGAS